LRPHQQQIIQTAGQDSQKLYRNAGEGHRGHELTAVPECLA
jgi:hypothetical protein